MHESGIRTVVLAREGTARDRIVEGLIEAGAAVVQALDPLQVEPTDVEALDPAAVVVALEPAVEDALDAFQPLLSGPGRTVIFEEAALVLERSGWDAARWVRHLAAKLHGVGSVLPPGAEPADEDVAPEAETPATAETGASRPGTFAFDPVAAEFDDVPGADAPRPMPAFDLDFEFELADTDDMTYVPPVADAAPVSGLDTFPLEDEASHAPVEPASRASAPGDEYGFANPIAAHGADAPGVEIAQDDAGTLRLVDDADDMEAGVSVDGVAAIPPAPPPSLDLGDLESRIAGLSLADTDSYGHGPRRGVVLVEGGLGGPDAVRQLLGAIPEGFPRPILIRLQLDGGRYDRLVRQMERATSLPVQLAEAGMSVVAGEVYFLSPGLLPAMVGGTLQFSEGGTLESLPDAVPAEDSALLFLSGADPALVPVALGAAWQGALVGGQSDEGCYDSVAAHAVAQGGGPSGRPDEIADWLLARWMPGARQSEPGPGGLSL